MSAVSKLRVAIVAPPWLALPVEGYGGIELVLEGLISGLRKLDVEVEVFGNGQHKMPGVTTHALYKKEQFEHIHKPNYEVLPILLAHMQFALNKIEADGKFDVIHDHNTFIGTEILSLFTRIKGVPPAVHTFHGPPFSNQAMLDQGIPDNRPMFEQLTNPGNLYFVGISNTLVEKAPKSIQPHILPTVYNAIDLDIFPFIPNKKDYFITLARFSPDKGQHIAAMAAAKLKKRLRMAGTVSGIGSSRKLLLELSNPLSGYRGTAEFKYYSDKILPQVIRHPKITYSGNLSGSRKMKFIAEAKALLFPIQWEEPFGMAVIEALACGTPVIAMNRGAMPEIIEHGVTGFLANNEQEFIEYMQRVDEIDPEACRRSVEEKFSSDAMASAYLDRYKQAIALSSKKTGKR
jgi:glycosyltransferase involved in cell wall biosynthesis